MQKIAKENKVEDWLQIKNLLAYNLPESVGENFNFLMNDILKELKKQPRDCTRLSKLFFPIWRYYITCYLNTMRIFDKHKREDTFQEVYLYCIGTLPKVKIDINEIDLKIFNGLKSYYNGSIRGMLLNILYNAPRSQGIYEVVGYDVLSSHQVVDYNIKDFEIEHDNEKLNKVIDSNFSIFMTMCINFLDKSILSKQEFYRKRYEDTAKKEYLSTGKLLTGKAFFTKIYGVFVDAKQNKEAIR